MSNDNRGDFGRPDTRALIAANYPLVLHYARRLAPWAAEDIAQDACVLAMQWDNYKPGKPVRNWLYWCVMSAREKRRRAEAKPLLAEEAVLGLGEMHTEPNQEHAVDLAMLMDRINGLPPRQRQVMAGIAAGSHTGEISRELGITGQAAATTARKARAKLAA